ncbi:sedoheptulose-1,7-bisphosphatase, partial [Colletotrichum higginsianum]
IGFGPNGVADCEIIRASVRFADAPFKTRYFAPANLRHAADDERYGALIARFIREKFLYELYPIALIVECAGGKAIDPADGRPLLDKASVDCDGRAGLICGTAEEVDIVKRALLD